MSDTLTTIEVKQAHEDGLITGRVQEEVENRVLRDLSLELIVLEFLDSAKMRTVSHAVPYVG